MCITPKLLTIMYSGAWGLSDNSVHETSLFRDIYPMYYMASLLPKLLTVYHPLVLNGGSLGTSLIFQWYSSCNKIADSKKNLQVDVYATWIYKLTKYNTKSSRKI